MTLLRSLNRRLPLRPPQQPITSTQSLSHLLNTYRIHSHTYMTSLSLLNRQHQHTRHRNSIIHRLITTSTRQNQVTSHTLNRSHSINNPNTSISRHRTRILLILNRRHVTQHRQLRSRHISHGTTTHSTLQSILLNTNHTNRRISTHLRPSTTRPSQVTSTLLIISRMLLQRRIRSTLINQSQRHTHNIRRTISITLHRFLITSHSRTIKIRTLSITTKSPNRSQTSLTLHRRLNLLSNTPSQLRNQLSISSSTALRTLQYITTRTSRLSQLTQHMLARRHSSLQNTSIRTSSRLLKLKSTNRIRTTAPNNKKATKTNKTKSKTTFANNNKANHRTDTGPFTCQESTHARHVPKHNNYTSNDRTEGQSEHTDSSSQPEHVAPPSTDSASVPPHTSDQATTDTEPTH